jgi:hypothetical protein
MSSLVNEEVIVILGSKNNFGYLVWLVGDVIKRLSFVSKGTLYTARELASWVSVIKVMDPK